MMQRREFTVGLMAAVGSAAAPAATRESDAAAGVRAALERGALEAVGQLGRADGFLGNPKVRIELPGHLAQAARLMRAMGQGARVDELVTAMNRAAEAAVPEARTIFVAAVRSMSVEDALKIVRGGPTSATEFFAAKTRGALTQRFLPIVTRATERVRLAARYNAVAARAGGLGLLGGDDTSIQKYVTAKALDGLYTVVGEQERQIRADPVGTGSALLKRVFGG